jgi:hypothetical protein
MYFESLPEECPPSGSEDADLGIVWRLIKGTKPCREDFLSHAALKKHKPGGVDDCQWASCSLFKTEQSARSKTKLASLKGMSPVSVHIPEGAGRSMTKGMHIDFWRYATFDPMEFIRSGAAGGS